MGIKNVVNIFKNNAKTILLDAPWGRKIFCLIAQVEYVLRRRVLDNEWSQFVRQVSASHTAAGLADQVNFTFGSDLDHSFGVLILLAQHELLNKSVQELLKIIRWVLDPVGFTKL